MKKTIFDKVGLSKVAMATASDKGVMASALSEEEVTLLTLAKEFNVPVPTMDTVNMSTQARSEAFSGVQAALKKVLMESSKGREILGNSILEPLKKEQLYSSTLRRAFKFYKLGAGQENFIPLELDVRAYTVSQNGDPITNNPYGLEGIEPPLQKLEARVLFDITDIYRGKYDLEGTALIKCESEIFKEEDRRIAKLWDAVSASGESNTPIVVSEANFLKTGLYTILKAVANIEGQMDKVLNPSDIWFNPVWTQVFRTMSNYENGFQISFNTAEELTKQGIIAQWNGLRLNRSNVLPHNKVYVTAEPETFGGFVEALGLTAIDQESGTKVGFVVFEQVGMCVSNPKGLATIIIS
jgi:hypothetical protein